MTDAATGETVYGTLRATLPMPTGRLTGSAWAMVQATAEVVRAPDVTLADLQALVVELQTTVREMERQRVAAAAAAAQAPSLALASYRWTVAGSLAGLVGALIALLAYVQTVVQDAEPDPTPRVDVNVSVRVEQPPSPPIAVQPGQSSADDDHTRPVAPTPPADDRRGTDR